jgi:nucleoid-associated protein YgaU
MRTTHSPATAGRPLARVLKALASLAILACAVAGLPLLLAYATPVVWEAGHEDLAHLLDRQDTGAAFLMLLVLVGWLGWAQFTLCAVAELVAQLRGRTWRAPRGLGASQRAAAALIGSIIVFLPAGSALASDAQAAPGAVTASPRPAQTQAASVAETGSSAAPAETAAAPTYTVRDVRPAESLWSIAERELGDGERWREISALNEGRTMADGQVFRSNSFLQPGWRLQMPDAAGGGEQARTQLGEGDPVADEESERSVTVHEGDSLSAIADEELGNASAWPDLFEANRGQPQPEGLPPITDPDVIYAGQQITVPEARSDEPGQGQQERGPNGHGHSGEEDRQSSPPPAAETPEGENKPDKQTPTSDPAQQPPGQEGNAPGMTPEPSLSAPPSSSAPATSNIPAPSVPSDSASAGDSTTVPTVLGAGALLAAAVTGALALRRVLQRRRRAPGETIAIASETSPAEAKLAVAAQAGGAARLDLALRTLAHLAAQTGGRIPAVKAARIAARTLKVLPDDLTREAQAPFAAGRDGWWVLPPGADLLAEDEARDVPAPYPALVTVGTTLDGALLLLNLAHVPALLLDGNPLHITEVCTSLALELGMSPWANDAEVVAVGFGEDLPQLMPTTRISHMRQPEHALRDLGERLLEAHQMPETQHHPYLVLCALPLKPDTAWGFADLMDKPGTIPVTLIAPANPAAAHFPQAEVLNASLDQPQHVDCAGTQITMQRLEHAAYEQITAALTKSAQAAHPAEGAWQDVPAEPGHRPKPGQAASGEVRTLKSVPQQSAPSSSAATSSPVVPAADLSQEVFPALLAATADPSGLRLLPTATVPGEEASGPGTEAEAREVNTPAAAEGNQTQTVEPKADEGDREPSVPQAPEIRVLGPLEVTGVDSNGHGPKMAQLAALLYFRPGRSAETLCSAMDPVTPWSVGTLNSRLQGLRSCLGNDPAGDPYVPRRKSSRAPYLLSPKVRCDWAQFLQLAEQALPLGPSGLPNLERALALVRGKPFGGQPLPWAEPYQQEMITRIIDVAHTVATHRISAGPHQDLTAARRAVIVGLDVDETAELLYRALIRIEDAAGNQQGLRAAIARVQKVNRELDCSLEPETEQLIRNVLGGPGSAVR